MFPKFSYPMRFLTEHKAHIHKVTKLILSLLFHKKWALGLQDLESNMLFLSSSWVTLGIVVTGNIRVVDINTTFVGREAATKVLLMYQKSNQNLALLRM